MGEIVSAINCLCKLLNNLICTSLRPEFFRLSKMNKLNSEETLQFWSILHNLCCFSTSESCQSDAVKCVTSYLLTKGRVLAYSLPPSASPRQLLLCFGWLLSHGVIETIIDKLILDTPLSEELPVMLGEPIDNTEPVGRPLENDSEDLYNYAMFLTGLIQHNLRAISNYRQERVHLLAKLHKATTEMCGLPHLSAGDVSLLACPELVPDFLTRCQHCRPIFEAYSKWHKKSPVFWQWMDSILKEEESLDLNNHLSEKELCHLIEFSKMLENNVRRIARLEDEDIAEEELEFLTTRRMRLSDSGQFLENATSLLDSKIEILTKVIERKKQELQIKLLNNKLDKKADEINTILNQFGFSIPNSVNSPSEDQPLPSTVQGISKLSLQQLQQNT